MYVVGPLAIREFRFEHKGQSTIGHSHQFDHATECVTGALLVERTLMVRNEDGTFKEVMAQARMRPGDRPINIEKGVHHKLTAEADGTMYRCIYPHREIDGSLVEHFTGWGYD